MTKKLVVMFLLVLIVFSLYAEQGKYDRKSVSSVHSVWVQKKGNQTSDFDYEFFNRMIKLYIEIPRFDYNELPKSVVRNFVDQANNLQDINAVNIGEVLERTVVPEIKRLLSDPDLQRMRATDFQDESARVQFAQIKAKEYGLTEEQIMQLMTSAYIYLPYITKFTKEFKDNTYNYEIKGGILWYNVRIQPDGSVELNRRQASTAMGMGSASTEKAKAAAYSKFVLGNEVIRTTPDEYAKYDAIQAWVKNLGVKMKEMPEFSLSAQVVEVLPGKVFSVELGHREGIHLDDGYYIVDLFENTKGELQKKKRGYARIIHTADNRTVEKRNERSRAKAFYGKGITQGAILLENPRLGIDFSLNMGTQSGMKIPASSSAGMLSDDATSQVGVLLDAGYNIAPIVGVSQLFYDLEFGMGFVDAQFNPAFDSDDTPPSVFTIALYTGFTKKYWYGRSAFAPSCKIGIDAVSINASTGFTPNDYSLFASAYGVKFGFDYLYMLNPNFLLNVGVDIKAGAAPGSATLTINDVDTSVSGAEDIRLGGVMLRVGANYSLRQLPFNLFGFLDPLKKY
ncbi:MAG: hypothetical protein CVU48_05615 [Candidatus Cloacimonetes bacterium HGW-Cloacimonetes-1]|jgi:hypothetical protein|nr:MAG: hypothetical protein CVU48_05615 [Candidatus Cloacimonetes bacterium HGW-Cloacimonetes-1]